MATVTTYIRFNSNNTVNITPIHIYYYNYINMGS